MNQYKKPYLILFNAITDSLEKMNESDFCEAKRLLIQAQIDAEEEYVSFEGNSIELLNVYKKDSD